MREAKLMGMTGHSMSTASPNAASARTILFDLQVEQHEHDEVYHREIARLPLHQRLNHMALHFAKYSGKIAAAADDAALAAVFTDVLIIAVSSANILNQELSALLVGDPGQHSTLLGFGRAAALTGGDIVSDRNLLLRETSIAAGRIAAACEKIDHLEDISYRTEFSLGIKRLAELSLAVLARHGVDPAYAVRHRLSDVRKRLKLHGRI